MKVLVCGGRDFTDEQMVFRSLDAIHARRPITLIIEGGAEGADRFGRRWAQLSGVPFRTFEANWRRLPANAGTFRNIRMLNEGRPELVVAFPGGSGTAHMVRISKAAGVRVCRVGQVAAGLPL